MNQAERHLKLSYNDKDLIKIITQSDNLKEMTVNGNNVNYIFDDGSVIESGLKVKNKLYRVEVKYIDNNWYPIGTEVFQGFIRDSLCSYNGKAYYVNGDLDQDFIKEVAISVSKKIKQYKVRVRNYITDELIQYD